MLIIKDDERRPILNENFSLSIKIKIALQVLRVQYSAGGLLETFYLGLLDLNYTDQPNHILVILFLMLSTPFSVNIYN